ncbi:hypothetical protein MXB_4009 [Myxobolus squamalis]|nr:hypothetical protein MXB_4009 [Myxobolus squamalis]
MFRLELAHWFYLDNYCLIDFKLPKLSFRNFVSIFIQRYECLANVACAKEAIGKFSSYKNKVPVYGLAMVSPNMDQVLLIFVPARLYWFKIFKQKHGHFQREK